MHEMALAEGVLQLVEETARLAQAKRIKRVILEIGQLSAVEPESLAFCFDAVAHGSLAEGAALEIIDVPGRGWCASCAESVPLSERYCACPKCGAYQVRPTSGTEMRVKEIAIE